MLEIKGQYNTAVVYTNNIEPDAVKQIETLCNQEFVRGSKIRIMP
ncbi:MAG: RNA-splicing ligase RtcB, partial [Firmicutes bacterium]|nr:RNA-splicing ligase RtcB [Bacillota bacterium]